MFFSRVVLFMSLALYSLAGLASDKVAEKMMFFYLYGLDSSLQLSIAGAENGISPNQLKHLNATAIRTAVDETIVDIIEEMKLPKEAYKDVANQKLLLEQIDKKILRVNQMLENYVDYVVDSRTIGFRDAAPFSADGRRVDELVKGINDIRTKEKLPKLSKELVASPLYKEIVRINFLNSKTDEAVIRLHKTLGKSFLLGLLKIVR